MFRLIVITLLVFSLPGCGSLEKRYKGPCKLVGENRDGRQVYDCEEL